MGPLRRACGNPAATLVDGGSIHASVSIHCEFGRSCNAKQWAKLTHALVCSSDYHLIVAIPGATG